MKTLIKVNSIDELKLDADGYILGFNDFCLSFEKTFSIDEIKSIVKEYSEKEIFVSLNKMIFNYTTLCDFCTIFCIKCLSIFQNKSYNVNR